jgi:hypothetical protein
MRRRTPTSSSWTFAGEPLGAALAVAVAVAVLGVGPHSCSGGQAAPRDGYQVRVEVGPRKLSDSVDVLLQFKLQKGEEPEGQFRVIPELVFVSGDESSNPFPLVLGDEKTYRGQFRLERADADHKQGLPSVIPETRGDEGAGRRPGLLLRLVDPEGNPISVPEKDITLVYHSAHLGEQMRDRDGEIHTWELSDRTLDVHLAGYQKSKPPLKDGKAENKGKAEGAGRPESYWLVQSFVKIGGGDAGGVHTVEKPKSPAQDRLELRCDERALDLVRESRTLWIFFFDKSSHVWRRSEVKLGDAPSTTATATIPKDLVGKAFDVKAYARSDQGVAPLLLWSEGDKNWMARKRIGAGAALVAINVTNANPVAFNLQFAVTNKDGLAVADALLRVDIIDPVAVNNGQDDTLIARRSIRTDADGRAHLAIYEYERALFHYEPDPRNFCKLRIDCFHPQYFLYQETEARDIFVVGDRPPYECKPITLTLKPFTDRSRQAPFGRSGQLCQVQVVSEPEERGGQGAELVPVQGAHLVLNGEETLADEQGMADLPLPDERGSKQCSLEVEADGFETFQESYESSALARPDRWLIHLRPAPLTRFTLSLLLLDAKTKAPITGLKGSKIRFAAKQGEKALPVGKPTLNDSGYVTLDVHADRKGGPLAIEIKDVKNYGDKTENIEHGDLGRAADHNVLLTPSGTGLIVLLTPSSIFKRYHVARAAVCEELARQLEDTKALPFQTLAVGALNMEQAWVGDRTDRDTQRHNIQLLNSMTNAGGLLDARAALDQLVAEDQPNPQALKGKGELLKRAGHWRVVLVLPADPLPLLANQKLEDKEVKSYVEKLRNAGVESLAIIEDGGSTELLQKVAEALKGGSSYTKTDSDKSLRDAVAQALAPTKK